MRVWLRVFAAVLAAAFFSLSIHFFRRPADPVFEGRYCSQWTEDLLSPDYKTRSEAQSALFALGESSVPQIRVLLRKRNNPWEARFARLNRWLPFLQYQISDAVLCRQRGAEMIGLLGAKGRAAIPALVDSLAMDGCAADAERALMRCGNAALPALERSLASRNVEIRCRGAKLLRDFDEIPASTVLALIQLSRDRQPSVRREAVHTLGEASSKPELVDLNRTLMLRANDQAPEVRAAAIEALGKRRRAPDVLAAVRHALADSAVVVRLQAAKALWQLQGDSATVLPVLTRILPTSESWQAAYALAQMGAAAAPAVPSLIEALRKERVPRPFRTPPSCAFALGQIGPVAIPALQPLLAATDAPTRLNAVLAIGFMGNRGKNAVPELLPLLDDQDPEVRHATALTLATIGAEREQIVAGLSACLGAEDIYMRSTAAQILREIAPDENWVVNLE